MSRLINPYQQFLDDAGNVVESGTLTFCENGDVNTQKNIYSDADLTTVGSNPYALDGSGRVTGDVWLDGEYTVVLKDAAGATIRTMNDVSSLTSSTGGGGSSEVVQGDVENKFVYGNFRLVNAADVTISGSYKESPAPGVYVKAQGTPTNGTIKRSKTTLVGTSGYALLVDELTTGAGGTVDYRFRWNSVDSRDLVNQAAIFQCSVLQQTGASKTYTISVYKANVEDSFGGTTLISASSGTSVSDSVNTTISHAVADMGDCSNGIEIVVSIACGAISTKDIYLTDVVFRKGSSLSTFQPASFDNIVLYDMVRRDIGKLEVFPIGTAPRGYLECIGSAISRTTYAELFNVLGTTYGSGDGSTTFNIPDYRGEFWRGWDRGAGNDPDAASRTDRGDGATGDNVGTKQAGQYESHAHQENANTIVVADNNNDAVAGGTVDWEPNSSRATPLSTEASGGNETRPRNVNVMKCIFYGWRN